MVTSDKQQSQGTKRLLEHMLKQKGSNRAEIMMALQAIKEQEDTGIDNSVMMKDANGREIYYLELEKKGALSLSQNIKKKVFELFRSIVRKISKYT